MGLSQAQVGAMMDYSSQVGQRTVSALEGGSGSLEQYMNAAAALGVNLELVIEYVRSEPEG